MKYTDFSEQLLEKNGKWEISFLLSDLYQKRGDTYLLSGDYPKGTLDFQRIFKGVPQMAGSTERWRILGETSTGVDYYLDVKSAEFTSGESARFWTRFVNKKDTNVMEYEVDCKKRRLKVTHMLTYNSSGEVVKSSDFEGGWEEVVPDSIGEQIVSGACFSR